MHSARCQKNGASHVGGRHGDGAFPVALWAVTSGRQREQKSCLEIIAKKIYIGINHNVEKGRERGAIAAHQKFQDLTVSLQRMLFKV